MIAVLEMTKDGPWWTHKEYIKDSEGRRPDHPDYDSTTLFIPPEEWDILTPGMQRYWESKMKNFDKIVLYRFGQWFLVFYQDADKCNKHIDLHIPPKLMQTYLGFH
jgi:DNA mismatch repair protein MSH6